METRNLSGSRLLGLLGSGVQPGALRDPGPRATIAGASFDDLLRRADLGAISSGLRVKVDKEAGVELSEAEVAALSAAADRAAAAGMRRALVMLDGKSVVLDVGSRTVTGKAEFSGGVLAGIDGVINLATAGGAGGGAAAAILPVPSAGPSTLLNQ